MGLKVQDHVERFIFWSRWLLAPMYLGLVIVLIVLMVKFVGEIVVMVAHALSPEEALGDGQFIIDLLNLLDLVLMANLILIVLFAGYENFVSKIDVAADSVDRPGWMGAVDFSGLKIKLIGSLVAISVIELLANFVELGTHETEGFPVSLFWRIMIHLTFVVSGVLFAVMDYISDMRAIKSAEMHGSGSHSEMGSSNSAV
ncbi:MAG: hypothetical protein RLZZ600_1107 [Actinomycetota bacterium]|jgi:uncharacterized protein (TIGR00645 family)